ncbi:unnamed protein product [Urochloa decumbens]|uniref:Uncharacterized protein n=1 Tax=Urochloa decumbens TaxID=240449 RepID=A0ABC9B546_9POAL
MAAANTSGTALTMKLLVDSSPWRPRVVFAEAGKDTVDFLFSLLAMPTGTAVNLLGRESLAGSMGNLYGSAENLDGAYVHPGAANKQDAILCAALQPPAATGPRSWLFRLPEPTPAAPKKFFNCGYYYCSGRNYVTEVSGTRCPNCHNQMVTEAKPIGPSSQEAERKGFVQGGTVTYTVTDDLVITPMSNVSSMALLSAYAVRCVGALQERTVQIGYKEGVEILRAALQSKTVLTDVFIAKKTPSMSTPSLSSGKSYESLAWRA